MRIRSHGVQYHIIARCNNGEPLLQDGDDRTRVALYLKHYCQGHDAALYGYVIMPSHLHLLMETQGESHIDVFMHDFCLAVAHYFNRRHHRGGHFWRHRYRSHMVIDDHYSLACLSYIDRNPVAAGLVHSAADWLWSSYRSYAEGQRDDLLTELPSYRLLGESARERHVAYRHLVHSPTVDVEDQRLLFEGRFRRGSKRYTKLFKECTSAVHSYLHSSTSNLLRSE